MAKDILAAILAIIVGVSVIVGIVAKDRADKLKRAQIRAEHLNFIKTELEKYKAEKGAYPNTGLKLENDQETALYQSAEKYPIAAPAKPMPSPVVGLSLPLYESAFFSECAHFDSYIPEVSFKLPHDPTNFCQFAKKGGYYGGNGPQYAYASNGKDYKFIILYLADEICDNPRFKEFVDSARGCNNYNAAWSVYSEGAKMW